MLVAVAASLVSSFLQTPVYEAEAHLLLQPTSNVRSLFDQQGGSDLDPIRETATAIQVLQSAPVQDRVKKICRAPRVSANVVGETNVVAVHARNTDAAAAARIANVYATSYVEFKQTQAIDEDLAASAQVKAKVDDLQRQIATLPDGPQRDALISQQSAFKQTLDQLQVSTSLDNGGAQVVSPAQIAGSPVEASRLPAPARVAIVDLDLRRPRLHEVFSLDNDKGFTSVLLGRVSLEDAL